MGDPLADLACARAELTCAYGHDACERFTASYLAARSHRTAAFRTDDLAIWDVYVSVAFLTTLHLWGLAPGTETVRRSTTREFHRAATTRLAAIG